MAPSSERTTDITDDITSHQVSLQIKSHKHTRSRSGPLTGPYVGVPRIYGQSSNGEAATNTAHFRCLLDEPNVALFSSVTVHTLKPPTQTEMLFSQLRGSHTALPLIGRISFFSLSLQ